MTDTAHVVIVGAGFAGLSAVGKLRKADLHVTVIDKHLYSTFQPLLYQVATGGLNPGDVAYPVGGFTARRNARYIRGDLAAIDPAARVVRLAGGREVGYDYLILATGVSANYFGVQGAEENTFGLYTRADAIVLRDHIMNGFEWLSADPDGRREFAVTVVGGGATGVELAGTLGELRSDVLRATFPDVDPARLHIRLVETAPELLMPFHPKLREYTRRQLVEARHRHQGEHHDPRGDQGSRAARGRHLASERPHGLDGRGGRAGTVAAWGLPQGKAGRLLVGPDLRVAGHRPDLRHRRHRAEPGEPVAPARAARAAGGQARGRAGHPPAARRADRAVPLPRQGHHGHDRPPLRRGAARRAARASPGRSPGSPGWACTWCTCSATGTGSRR